MRLTEVARSLLVVVSPPGLLILGGRGTVLVSTPDVSQSSASFHLHLQFFRLVCFQFLDQWRSIISITGHQVPTF